MLNVTQEQKTAFLESTPQEIQITATPETGTAITITNANIVQGSFSIDRSSVSGNDVEIGNVSSAELIMALNNSDGTFDNFTLEGATLEVEIRPQGVGSFISMGKFVVDEITRNKTTINVVALDYMVALDVEMDRTIFADEETAPSAIGKILTAIGITTTPVLDLVNDTVAFTPSFMHEGATYRDFLICILEITGTNAYFIGDTFYATWYSSTVAETLTTANRVMSDMQGYGVEITGVVVQDGETVYEVGTKEYPITITSNNLITSVNVTAVLTGLQSRLVGFTYQPFTATTLPMPWLMPMDKINYVKDETTHPTIITNAQFILNQNTPFEAKGQSPLAKGYAKKAMTKAQENNMKALEQSVESSINEIKNYFWHDAQGVHVTEHPNDATIGNNVLIDRNSLDIRDGETTLASFGDEIVLGDTEYQQTRIGVSSLVQEAGIFPPPYSERATIGASLTSSVDEYTTTGSLLLGGMIETSSRTATSRGDVDVSGKKLLYARGGHTAYMIDLVSELSTEYGFGQQRLRFDVANGITNGYKHYGYDPPYSDWTTVFQMTPTGSFSYICEDIEEDTNLNSYTRQGTYACRQNATISTLSNCPTEWAFRMEVTSITKHLVNTNYVVQKITDYQANEYVRWAWRSGTTWTWSVWRVLVNRLSPTLNWNNTYVTNDRGGTVLVRDNVLYLNVWFKTSQQIPQDTVILSLGGLTRNFTRGYFPITGTAQVFGQVYTNNNGNSFTSNTALAQNTAYRFINAVLPLQE